MHKHADRIEQAFIFGSVAKVTDTGKSDIDVVVVGTVPELELFDATSRLQRELGRPVQFSVYEPREWRALVKRDPVVSQIAKGPSRR